MSGSDPVTAKWRDAQDVLIGTMLVYPELVPEIVSQTDETDFEGFRAAAYTVIRNLSAENRPIDANIVLDILGPEHRERLRHAINMSPTAANTPEYLKSVRRESRLAALRRLGTALSGVADMDEARPVVAKANELTVERRGLEVRSWAEMIDRFMDARQDGREREFLDFGIPALTETLQVDRGKYILLGGAPSSGKSALMFQLALHMSATRRVGIFSFETDVDEETERLASYASQVPFYSIIRNRLGAEDWQRINKAFSDTYAHTLETIDASGMTAGDIVSLTRARRYEVIFVDYVQLVTPSGNVRDIREQQVARISRQLQGLAKQPPGVTVVGLSQLSRPDRDKKGNSREPDLRDFRESGQLEQDADAAMILFRPFPDAAGDSRLGRLRRLSIVKNKRNGLAKINFSFDGARQTFHYLTPGEARQAEAARGLEEPDSDNPFAQRALPL